MGFIALIVALLVDQARPLPSDGWARRAVTGAADAVMRWTNAGERRYGVIGWLALVAAVLLAVIALQWLAGWLHPLAVFVVHLLVLHLTIGLRTFLQPFGEIQLALAAGDLAGARRVLLQWLRRETPEANLGEAPLAEVCRQSIAGLLLAGHRAFFAPLFWYIVLPGAVGPVLYRLAATLSLRWAQPGEVYGQFAGQAFRALDWLPLRASASGFAIAGNFEDAVYAWRGAVAAGAGGDARGLLLATGGGALGLRIADPALEARWSQEGEAGLDVLGGEPGPDGMRSALGLVWRSVVLWVALFAMLTVANWLGR
jgi:adenosylcobinamide-phosphate synthase